MATRKTGGASARLGGARKRASGGRATLGNPVMRKAGGGGRKTKFSGGMAKATRSSYGVNRPGVARKRRKNVAKKMRGY